jgi:hypothetical protein
MSDEPEAPTRTTGDAGPAALAYVASRDTAAMWDTDLEPDRGGWRPGDGEGLWRQVLPWRCERTIAELDGQLVEVVELTNGAEPAWDWRTVSFWVTALGPGWRVHLRHSGRIDLIRPAVRPAAP